MKSLDRSAGPKLESNRLRLGPMRLRSTRACSRLRHDFRLPYEEDFETLAEVLHVDSCGACFLNRSTTATASTRNAAYTELCTTCMSFATSSGQKLRGPKSLHPSPGPLTRTAPKLREFLRAVPIVCHPRRAQPILLKSELPM